MIRIFHGINYMSSFFFLLFKFLENVVQCKERRVTNHSIWPVPLLISQLIQFPFPPIEKSLPPPLLFPLSGIKDKNPKKGA